MTGSARGFAGILLGTGIPNLTAGIADLQHGSGRGTGFAVVQLLTTIGAAIGPLVAGAVSDATGSLGLGLAGVTGLMVLGAVLSVTAPATQSIVVGGRKQ